jgi:hypothetical protein
MNEIRRPDPEAEKIARVREIVERRALPDFVTGFDVRLGDFEGDPAMWIVFKLTGSDELGVQELQRRSEILVQLQQTLTDELLNDEPDRFPFFRSQYPQVVQHTA